MDKFDSRNQGVANVHAMLGKFVALGDGFPLPKAPISSFNHFEYTEQGVKCWTHSTIGTGVLIKMRQESKGLSDFRCKYQISKYNLAEKEQKIRRYFAPGTNTNDQEDDCAGDSEKLAIDTDCVTFQCHNR